MRLLIHIRQATKDDVQAMAAALAAAFADDPVMAYLFPRERDRRGRLRRFMRLATNVRLRGGEVWVSDGYEGAALWARPGHVKTSAADIVRQVPLTVDLRSGILRGMRLLRMLEKVHPKEPHWYLAVLGTEPLHQGKGFGSRLMAPVLERCDAEGLPAYLESSKESNIAFYARQGFEVSGTVQPPGGPPLYPMWREPRS
ncbi:MAG: GNAT family N-acetyltransferase [Acidimicrobiales bacterium]